VRGFDADVVVMPEAFRFGNGTSVLEPLRDDGYTIRTAHFAELAQKVWRPGDIRPAGSWELAICSRLPMRDDRELPIGTVFRDPAGERRVIACIVRAGDIDVELVAVHTSSKLWYAGPLLHMRGLARHLADTGRPAILAGDFNFWGPGVTRMLPGWKRAVIGRTWPAHRPHSQIDHILVNARIAVLRGEVLPACGSDHRPVRAALRVRSGDVET
jgi:endonuclease/exonuclease/phosphatase (EEP) superfamily protein YafD